MPSIAESQSLFEIDMELDELVEEIQEEIENNGQASDEQMGHFQEYCKAHGEKIDGIGRFLQMMEARTLYCRSEANRLSERARSSDRKLAQTKNMVMYYLESRGMAKVEGMDFTLRRQKNGQSSVRIINEHLVPMNFKIVEAYIDGTLWDEILNALLEDLQRMLKATVKQASPNNEAIRQSPEEVPGAEVKRGQHLRVA